MKNTNKDHPEVRDLKNICEINPDDKTTKQVCQKLKKNKKKIKQ